MTDGWTPRAMLLRRRADAESQGGSCEIELSEIDALLAALEHSDAVMGEADRKLIAKLDEAIALGKEWKPNHAWPDVTTVMLTKREAEAIRHCLRGKS